MGQFCDKIKNFFGIQDKKTDESGSDRNKPGSEKKQKNKKEKIVWEEVDGKKILKGDFVEFIEAANKHEINNKSEENLINKTIWQDNESITPSIMSYSKFETIHIPENFPDIPTVFRAHGYKLTRRFLGQGSFGIVVAAELLDETKNEAEKTVAVKMMEVTHKLEKDLKAELFAFRQVHPNIIQFFNHIHIAGKLNYNEEIWKFDKAYLVMEFADLGDLRTYIQKKKPPEPTIINDLERPIIKEKYARLLFRQMVNGIKHLHGSGISHNDLKSQNILLKTNEKNANKPFVKVTDFGLSQLSFKRDEGFRYSHRALGTFAYMAPEALEAKYDKMTRKKPVEYSPFAIDIWALGIILYEILTSQFPFKHTKKEGDERHYMLEIKELIKEQRAKDWNLPEKLRKKLSKDLKILLGSLLEPNGPQRINIGQVSSHPWVIEYEGK